MSILEDELAELIADALEGADIPFTIIIPRTTTTERPVDWPIWQEWIGDPVTVSHEFRGFVDAYDKRLISAGVVSATDVKIMLLQPGMPFRPVQTDVIIARGQRYRILEIGEDPAQATLEIRAAI